MKKFSLSIIVSAIVLLCSSCAIYDVVKDITDKEDGSIMTKNGMVYTGRVEMPNVNTKKVTVQTVDSQKVVVEASNIEAMLVWKKTHTDIKHVLRYIPSYWFDKKNKLRDPMWMALIETGPNIDFYACSYNYSIPSDGALKIKSLKGGSITYYGMKKGETVAKAIDMTDYSKRSARKAMVEYLSDDPVLCKKITDLEIEPGDYETIAKEYNPKK